MIGTLVAGLVLSARLTKARSGLRTMTPDGRFVVGSDPKVPDFFWVAGLGGHGVTTCFSVGRLAADLISGLENGFKGERAFGQKGFAVFRGPDTATQEEYLMGLGRASSKGLARYADQLHMKAAQAYWRAHMDDDEMFYLRDSQARLEIIRRLKTNTSAASLQIEIKAQYDALLKEFAAPLGKYRHLFSALAIPNFKRAFEVAVQRETERRMTITAIALKRFQLRSGHHPAALGELIPQFLAAELFDPWSGRRFHYRLNTDGTFTLYSVGMDGRNDGGDPTPAKSTNAPPDMWTGKDAVWPTPVFPQVK